MSKRRTSVYENKDCFKRQLIDFRSKVFFIVFLSFGVYFLLSHFVVILSARSAVYVRIIKFMCVDIAKEALRSVFDGDAENDILYLLYFNSKDDSDGVEERKVFANKYFKSERKVFLPTKWKKMQSEPVADMKRIASSKGYFFFHLPRRQVTKHFPQDSASRRVIGLILKLSYQPREPVLSSSRHCQVFHEEAANSKSSPARVEQLRRD